MTVRELITQLEQYPQDAHVHLEVVQGLLSYYGHVLGASRSEPNVVVISNRSLES